MEERHLKPVMGPAGAWALSLGTSVGWGSLVVTCSGYLLQAGPLGSTVGLLIGGIIMLFISRSYAYMINCFPEAGGAYAYSREVFGWDQGFLTAWFLGLTYLAVLWANATSLPLFSRYFLGPVFRVGKLYTLFGYDIYLGEALLSSAAILLTAVLLTRREKDAMRLMILLAVVFSAGIALCFVYAFLNRDRAVSPEFLPDGNASLQIVKIAGMSPWAFIGFGRAESGPSWRRTTKRLTSKSSGESSGANSGFFSRRTGKRPWRFCAAKGSPCPLCFLTLSCLSCMVFRFLKSCGRTRC